MTLLKLLTPIVPVKCFDAIDHDLLLFKWDKYGICDIEQKWFRSYLSSRKQVVGCNRVTTRPNEISAGVPQGNVLGLSFF